jgi:4-nitrophenyl phosphatase
LKLGAGVELLAGGLDAFQPKAVTIDADGVLHRGRRVLPGALALLRGLDRRRVPWRIVTNNSRQTAAIAAAHYRHLGLPIDDGQVVTAADAMAAYIVQHHAGSGRPWVYPVGDRDQRATLVAAGCRLTEDDRRAEWVAVGVNRWLTFRRLFHACNAVRRGAGFVVANLDPTVPTEDGAIPGAGALAAAIQVATGREPVNIGKPSPELMLQALGQMGAAPVDAVHLGDRLDSDVLGARRAGMVAALVTTGDHTLEDALALEEPERPHLVASALPALMEWLFG